MIRVTLLLFMLFPPMLCGCGTFADAMAGPADDHLYYRGVRMDVAGIKNGVPMMAFDVPFSACADTLLAPSIAVRQIIDPDATHKSAMQAAGEGLAKQMVTDVMVPVTVEALKTADVEIRKEQSPPPSEPVISR